MNPVVQLAISVLLPLAACIFLLRYFFRQSIFIKIGITWFATLMVVTITLTLRSNYFEGNKAAYIIILLTNILCCCGAFAYVGISIIRPLNRLVGQLRKLGDGKLNIEIPKISRSGKPNELVFINRASTKLRDNLLNIVQQLTENINNINERGAATNEISDHLSDSTAAQSSSIEEISATMEEMVASIEQNARSAKESEEFSTKVQAGIQTVIDKTAESLNAVHKISTHITIVNDIAYQTNILALNAAVEAARAGEYGRGFAVVASEVRKLAERSRNAADQIVTHTKITVERTEQSAEQVNSLIQFVQQITQLVAKISNAINEELRGVSQVNAAIQELSEQSQSNASISQELNESASLLYDYSNRLKDLIQFFSVR